MVYIVDAQLPRRLSNWLKSKGHQSFHTLDLPNRNDTEDTEIVRIASSTAGAVVISKDRDFPDFRLIHGLPDRLLWITTGNINNNDLLEIFDKSFTAIHQAFLDGTKFLELTNDSLIIHE